MFDEGILITEIRKDLDFNCRDWLMMYGWIKFVIGKPTVKIMRKAKSTPRCFDAKTCLISFFLSCLYIAL